MAGKGKKVKLNYELLCKKIKENGKTLEEFSYEMGRSKTFVYGLRRSIEQPESVEKLMCMLLGLEPGSLIDTGSNNTGEARALENIYNVVHEIEKRFDELEKLLKVGIENTERIDMISRKINANTVQLEKIKESMQEQQKILKEFE